MARKKTTDEVKTQQRQAAAVKVELEGIATRMRKPEEAVLSLFTLSERAVGRRYALQSAVEGGKPDMYVVATVARWAGESPLRVLKAAELITDEELVMAGWQRATRTDEEYGRDAQAATAAVETARQSSGVSIEELQAGYRALRTLLRTMGLDPDAEGHMPTGE